MQSLPKRLIERTAHEARYISELAIAAIRGNGIKAYWYKDELNFGDLITPLLLKHFGYMPIYQRAGKSQVVSTGSVLEHLPADYTGVILGSGFIDEKSQVNFPSATVLAVRGKQTRARLGEDRASIAMGDPGLLAVEMMPRREKKKYKLGLVPHYSEKTDSRIVGLVKSLGSDATLIDVQDQPLAIFAAIDRCEAIISSSLHGLIVSDSLGISNRWMAPVAGLLGGRYKFDDYYSSIEEQDDPLVLRGDESLAELLGAVKLKNQEAISSVKSDLTNLWSSLGDFI